MVIKKSTITKLKNKVSSFKGTLWLKSWPDRAYFMEMTEQAMRDAVDVNKLDRQQALADRLTAHVEDEYEQDTRY